MNEATFFFVVSIVALVAALAFFFYRAKKDPENKGLEPGAILIKFFIKYPLTVFITMQLVAMISEAALLASIPETLLNVSASMATHMFIALVGALGAFMLTKYLGSFVSAFFSKEKFPVKLSVIMLTFCLSIISLVFTLGSPIYNLYAMASRLHQVPQLELYLTSLQVEYLGTDPRILVRLMAINKVPADYSPFQALHPGIVTSLALSTAHIFITIWEVLVSLLYALKNDGIQHAILGDFANVPPRKEEKKEEKKDEKKEEKKEEAKSEEKNSDKNEEKAKNFIIRILKIHGVPEAKIDNHANTLVSKVFSDQKEAVQKMADIISFVTKYDQAVSTKNTKDVEELKGKIPEMVNKLSGGSVTLPKN